MPALVSRPEEIRRTSQCINIYQLGYPRTRVDSLDCGAIYPIDRDPECIHSVHPFILKNALLFPRIIRERERCIIPLYFYWFLDYWKW